MNKSTISINKILILQYIKHNCALETPLEIIELCVKYSIDLHQKLKFSSKFISDSGLNLLDNNYSVIKGYDTIDNGIYCAE